MRQVQRTAQQGWACRSDDTLIVTRLVHRDWAPRQLAEWHASR